MSINDSPFREYRHLVSFYDDEKNIQISLESLREVAKYFLSQGYGVVYGVEELRKEGKEQDNSANSIPCLAVALCAD